MSGDGRDYQADTELACIFHMAGWPLELTWPFRAAAWLVELISELPTPSAPPLAPSAPSPLLPAPPRSDDRLIFAAAPISATAGAQQPRRPAAPAHASGTFLCADPALVGSTNNDELRRARRVPSDGPAGEQGPEGTPPLAEPIKGGSRRALKGCRVCV